MPVVLQRGEMPVRGGPGWAEVTCAGLSLFAAAVPMSAGEYRLGPGSRGPLIGITGPDGLTVLVAESAGA
jgi:hypothetical protein